MSKRFLLVLGTGLFSLFCLSHSAMAQDPKVGGAADPATGKKVWPLVIYNGSQRTIRYFSQGLSNSEQQTLRELEHAQNELSYLQGLQQLRLSSIKNEQIMAAQQRAGTRVLRDVTTIDNSSFSTGFRTFGRSGLGLPVGFRSFGGGFGFGSGFGGVSQITSASRNRSRVIERGAGDPTPFQQEMAKTLANQASPEYLQQAFYNVQSAMSKAQRSENLSTALGLKKPAEGGGIAEVAYGSGSAIQLTLKDGEVLKGSFVSETGDWITVATEAGHESIRKAEVKRIVRPRQK